MHVFLTRADSYEHASRAVFDLLEALSLSLPVSGYVLLKPNLISFRNPNLACTDPQIVRAAARYFLDRGCCVFVGDSPAFGSARKVALSCGLLDALQDLDVSFGPLDAPVPTRFGPFRAGISQKALDAALLVNLPKLKAHCQMRVSAGVKNLFGTVCGFRKPLIHYQYGDRRDLFPDFFIQLLRALPPTITLMDGIRAMHETGPTGGKPFPAGMIGASTDTVALDTAVYTMLGLLPKDVPIWRACLRQGLAGAFAENIDYPLEAPDGFACEGFKVPGKLHPQVFGAGRLIRSLYKRLRVKTEEKEG